MTPLKIVRAIEDYSCGAARIERGKLYVVRHTNNGDYEVYHIYMNDYPSIIDPPTFGFFTHRFETVGKISSRECKELRRRHCKWLK